MEFCCRLRAFFIGALIFFQPAHAGAAALPVDDYLRQVSIANDGYRGMRAEASGADLAARASHLLFMPQAFSKFEYIRDTRDTHAPEIEGERQIQRSYSFGIRQQTPFGLQFQLSYDANQSLLTGTDPALVPRPRISNNYIVPLFNISLWQNFLGRADRANRQLLESRMLAQSYGKAFESRAALVEAEGRYWKLASIREAIRLQGESLDRAKSVYDLSLKKKNRGLIDNSEFLLSEAAVQGKELELRSMHDEERSAARSFNSARGIDSDQVSDELSLPDTDSIKKIQPPERKGPRGDVKAIEHQSLAAEAGSEVAREQLLPSLNLYGTIFAWGVMLSFPLDQGTASSARQGFSRQIEGADLAYRRKVFEDENEWKDLNHKLSELKERLALAVRLEDIQKRKFEDLRRLRERGLTISFQVFQYELDYLNAALARVQIEGQLLGTWAQLKLYGGES